MQLFYLVHVLYGTLIKSLGVFSATNIRKYLEKARGCCSFLCIFLVTQSFFQRRITICDNNTKRPCHTKTTKRSPLSNRGYERSEHPRKAGRNNYDPKGVAPFKCCISKKYSPFRASGRT